MEGGKGRQGVNRALGFAGCDSDSFCEVVKLLVVAGRGGVEASVW